MSWICFWIFFRLGQFQSLFLRSSSIGGHLRFKPFCFWFASLSLSSNFTKITGYWDIQLLTFWGHLPLEVIFHWRSFSFKVFLILVWSPELKFKIWEISGQWLLRYLDFNILRSSSIIGCLHFKHFRFWFSPLSWSLKLKEYPVSGGWDI